MFASSGLTPPRTPRRTLRRSSTSDSDTRPRGQADGFDRGDVEVRVRRPGDGKLWAGSPFAWIRTKSSRRRGKIAEQLLSGWAAAKGLNVERSPDAEADRLIERRRVETKSSTRWATGCFRFQQLREQNYEYAVLLGIMPFDVRCWVVPKGLAIRKATPQHTGRRGRDTFWLSFDAADAPSWLRQYGGPLRKALAIMKHWMRPPHGENREGGVLTILRPRVRSASEA